MTIRGITRRGRALPWPINVVPFVPWPTQAKGPTVCSQIFDAQPANSLWSTNPLPINQTLSTISLIIDVSQEFPSQLVDLFLSPFVQSKSGEVVGQIRGKNRVDEEQSSWSHEKSSFPRSKASGKLIQQRLNLNSSWFSQREWQSQVSAG